MTLNCFFYVNNKILIFNQYTDFWPLYINLDIIWRSLRNIIVSWAVSSINALTCVVPKKEDKHSQSVTIVVMNLIPVRTVSIRKFYLLQFENAPLEKKNVRNSKTSSSLFKINLIQTKSVKLPSMNSTASANTKNYLDFFCVGHNIMKQWLRRNFYAL